METTITKLELVRANSKSQELDKKIETLTKQINDPKYAVLETFRLTSQLAEFAHLSENYASILELALSQCRGDVATMRSIQEALDHRENRSKGAMKLFTRLLRDKKCDSQP